MTVVVRKITNTCVTHGRSFIFAQTTIRGSMTTKELSEIKKGDWVFAEAKHMRGDKASTKMRWRKVTASVYEKRKQPYQWEGCGIAVRAHGYSEYWLHAHEIADHSKTKPEQ